MRKSIGTRGRGPSSIGTKGEQICKCDNIATGIYSYSNKTKFRPVLEYIPIGIGLNSGKLEYIPIELGKFTYFVRFILNIW